MTPPAFAPRPLKALLLVGAYASLGAGPPVRTAQVVPELQSLLSQFDLRGLWHPVYREFREWTFDAHERLTFQDAVSELLQVHVFPRLSSGTTEYHQAGRRVLAFFNSASINLAFYRLKDEDTAGSALAPSTHGLAVDNLPTILVDPRVLDWSLKRYAHLLKSPEARQRFVTRHFLVAVVHETSHLWAQKKATQFVGCHPGVCEAEEAISQILARIWYLGPARAFARKDRVMKEYLSTEPAIAETQGKTFEEGVRYLIEHPKLTAGSEGRLSRGSL